MLQQYELTRLGIGTMLRLLSDVRVTSLRR
jgi:hypothetical protein